MKKGITAISLCLMLFHNPIFAGVTGKISGRVTDAASGESLAGVNVIIDGTTMGTATNLDGYYVILNVPPGTYTLKSSMIGYANVTTANIVVVMNLTTTIDVQMSREALGFEEVIVVAERPVVRMDVSNSQLNVVASTIETMPVLDVTEVIGLQAGVQGLSVRGGRTSQTAFIVDGIIMNDERSNSPYSSVSLGSIDEVQVQTGGFNAEYGNIRSGVVNVVTKEGRRDRYSGSIIVSYQPGRAKHYGPSVYADTSYFTRPYLDPEVSYVGTANGTWDKYTQRQYPAFEGWNAISEASLQDNDPTNDLTPEAAKRIFEWQHRRQGDIKKPDYIVDITLGGPVPVIGDNLGNLRFYASYRDLREMFIYPLSRDSYDDNVSRLKITSEPNPDTKFTLTGMYGETHSVSPYSWKTTPTGRVLRSTYEIANLVNSSSGKSIIYMPGWYSPSTIYRSIYGVKMTRVINSETFYEVQLQHNRNKYDTFQMAERDTVESNELFPGYFADEAPYGYWGYGVTGIDGMGIGGWMNLGRDNSLNTTTSFRFDFSKQLNRINQYKAGLQVVYNNYNIRSFTRSPSMTTWNRDQVYKVSPYRIGAYLQDKLEFEGFIANLGLRFDFSQANTDRFELDEYDAYYKEGNGHLLEAEAPVVGSKPAWSLSPRLGVSHPITENSKLYFNYGHFRQEPASTYRFRIQREYNGLVTSIGEPNLDLEKTVAYELGYSHNLFDQFLLNIAAYYKNVTNQYGWISYRNINNSVQYSRAANNNYEDIRGLEITVDKRLGTWLTGFLNYTYMVRTYGYFGFTQYYEDPNEQRNYLSRNPYQERPHPQPYFRANLDLHTPAEWGPELLEIHPTGGWNMNVLGRWSAGSFTTYNPKKEPGILDNVQWKDSYTVELRFTKNMNLKKYNLQLYLDVSNALNTRFLSSAGFSNNFDYTNYMESLHFSWEEGIEKGNDRVGEYRDWGVDYTPMQSVPDLDVIGEPEERVLYYNRATDSYMQYSQIDGWTERSESWVKREVLDKKAYIDMPNFKYFTFLNPRTIKIGFKLNF